ncbi:GspH/FimT family pseudopilin [Pseudomonas sp.]|uniref:GspH/FimT family pseudopilin n=1 Tax=Pseudomonas sp. TaxID=306 RepID=UPI0032C2148E
MRRPAGFTLIEMLVVIVLIAVAAGLMATGIAQGLHASRERQAVREMVFALRQARSQAVLDNKPALLHFDLPGRWYGAPGQPRRSWPDTVQVRLVTARQLGSAVAFYPDGSSSGGHLLLTRGDRQWRIDIGWLTGDVRWMATP